MDLDPQQLKQKAFLLLQRERELFELRAKHESLAVWLALAQSLPQMIADPRVNLDDLFARLRKSMTTNLRFQRVLFFELGEAMLRPLSPSGPPRPLGADASSVIASQRFGMVNDAREDDQAALADVLGLERFIWSRIDLHGRPPVLLAAGYDRSKAKFYPALEAGVVANLRNTAQHIEGLLGNAALLSEIQDERDRLQRTNQLLESRDAKLSAMASELRAANERLEQRVNQRTEQLTQRNRDMRLVLDNVPTALLTVDSNGHLAAEHSAKVDEWFGSYQGSPRFADTIAAADPEFAQWFALGHETLTQRAMPLPVCLGQLPRRLRCKGRIYQCSYRLIGNGEDDFSLLITIEDVTEQKRLEQEEVEQRELLTFCAGLTRDRAGFLTFFEEADRLVHEIHASLTDPTSCQRSLHTLKGSSAMMGARVMAELCERAEEELAEKGPMFGEFVEQLRQRWSTIAQTIEPALGEDGKNTVEIPGFEFDKLCKDVERGLSREDISLRLRRFTFEAVDRPLGRLARYAKCLGERLGKPELSVTIRSDGAAVNPRRLGRLWTALVHFVRNAIDHGIEPPTERLAHGKPAHGHLTLQAIQTEQLLTVDIADDGRGIDWDRVAKVARARGMACDSEAALVRCLLSDGFTTKIDADSTSGRGLGLGAVAKTVASLGGNLSLHSQAGHGTTWHIVLPLMPAEGQLTSQAQPWGDRKTDG